MKRAGWHSGKPFTLIPEVLHSNLGRVTGYPDSGFMWFSSVPTGKFSDNISIRPRPLPSKSFPIHNSPIMLPTEATGCGRNNSRIFRCCSGASGAGWAGLVSVSSTFLAISITVMAWSGEHRAYVVQTYLKKCRVCHCNAAISRNTFQAKSKRYSSQQVNHTVMGCKFQSYRFGFKEETAW
jgi:hypothetical protein